MGLLGFLGPLVVELVVFSRAFSAQPLICDSRCKKYGVACQSLRARIDAEVVSSMIGRSCTVSCRSRQEKYQLQNSVGAARTQNENNRSEGVFRKAKTCAKEPGACWFSSWLPGSS